MKMNITYRKGAKKQAKCPLKTIPHIPGFRLFIIPLPAVTTDK
jgi:hypothetical protein